ncbi:class I SAM-dependent DNA methyltransferase [Aurantiacibacter poecillastricola]|uniref:class I SAM-dependent DNA methyltransferase n=1 Tax=Aurantiacibacter poecillastricola TaxID=3064385 RepID=UPI00273D6E98|nr:methyltransferase domain-containing protein [Aurantiacibacter sp. 219JJ12-13]MDP5263449.1 methyltransferase domain-containing protein [Aurantiacibacter sp. 219JJ12-13]
MGDANLDRIYEASGSAEMRELYDKWAEKYDADVEGSGYETPRRIAETLAELVPDKDTPLLDYGCGTGLSGVALAAQGFSTIDGCDLSEKMLHRARERECYRNLELIEPGQSLPKSIADYEVVAAVGVISKGAAPPSVYGEVLHMMKPGAILIFSLNDLSLAEPEYASLAEESAKAGQVEIVSSVHGPHLTGYEDNSGSTVTVVRKLG